MSTLRHLLSRFPRPACLGERVESNLAPNARARRSLDHSSSVPRKPLAKAEMGGLAWAVNCPKCGAHFTSAPLHLPRPSAYSDGPHPRSPRTSCRLLKQCYSRRPTAGLLRCDLGLSVLTAPQGFRLAGPPTSSHCFEHLTAPPCSWSPRNQMCRLVGIYPTE